MTSSEQAWLDLTQRTSITASDEVASVFSALKPITTDFLTRGTGEWQGYSIDTGHPGAALLEQMGWAGKTFRSSEDVEPVLVYDADGKRKLHTDWGHARLREMKYGNHNTIAMIYDIHPIIDYFHHVTDDLVAGVMDSKLFSDPLYFYLKRMS